MDTNGPNRQADAFWSFLAYLNKYVQLSKSLLRSSADDSGRTRLLSALAESMCPVLRADMSFVGYLERITKSDVWLEVVQDSISLQGKPSQLPRIIDRLKQMKWRLPFQKFDQMTGSTVTVFFDERLEELPEIFRNAVTALAISKVTLQEREYFLCFCDLSTYTGTGSRYEEFDKAMLNVATGLLGAGFESGVRGGRKAQQDIEEAQTRQFLLELVHELKSPIQAMLADASNLQAEMPTEWDELREMAARNLSAAQHLGSLIDNFQLILFEHRLMDEPLTVISLEEPLRAALEMFAGEAQAKGLKVLGPNTADGQPFPRLPLYINQLTIAFKNLIHNAVIYSSPQNNEYIPMKILGHTSGAEHYAIDITNYGIEITEADMHQGLLFKIRYRGEKARQVVASGSGLGLASVKQIVEKHRGYIEVTSMATGSGLFRNTFSIVLPIANSEKEGETL